MKIKATEEQVRAIVRQQVQRAMADTIRAMDLEPRFTIRAVDVDVIIGTAVDRVIEDFHNYGAEYGRGAGQTWAAERADEAVEQTDEEGLFPLDRSITSELTRAYKNAQDVGGILTCAVNCIRNEDYRQTVLEQIDVLDGMLGNLKDLLDLTGN